VEASAELGVRYLTLYAFSTENWERPAEEVEGIMELLVTTIRKEIDSLHQNHVRLQVIGNIEQLPELCKKELREAMDLTRDNDGLNLVMALSYSSRWEILRAARQIARDARSQVLNPEDIDAELFASYLCTGDFPDPELMIRTGGDFRISNFLLYQAAYAELYFTDTRWPDFRKENLYQAILDFQSRERRFGKTSEQIN
jgi:undecaprenyl diphosphate synthase